MGLFAIGALAWPPLLRAVNFTSALPFSNTPTMAKLPGMPPPSSQTRNGRTPRRLSSATIFGAPSPAHSSVQDEER